MPVTVMVVPTIPVAGETDTFAMLVKSALAVVKVSLAVIFTAPLMPEGI